MNAPIPRHTLFFDGVCGTCNAVVDFLLRVDSREQILFAPLQGETARRELEGGDLSDLATLIVRDPQGQIYRRSQAVWRIFALLPWPWRGVALIRFVPVIIRDFFYNLYARNRYAISGKRDQCRLPTADERRRFLE